MTDAFSYKDAKNWGKKYPQCNGKNQSPIMVIAESGGDYFQRIDKRLKLTDFQTLPTKMTIKNTGHTVEIEAEWPGKLPRLTGGPLHGNYVFEKATFLWAPKPTLDSAQEPEHFFDELEKNLHKVQSINSTAVTPPMRLTSLVDDSSPHFLFYKGSLDYPPCSESVTWFTYIPTIYVRSKLVNEFRKIKLAEGDVTNVRPVQPGLPLGKIQCNWYILGFPDVRSSTGTG
ncbi:carbonic anhydrase 7-like [Belonocnema kinseyi]|uniref:carbonic anhydrase 7-like n=1 Tax=Belonocnema kinseyi TaxID=2817044 RepID=UPI00143D7BD9|nr:carbonic anhydrase 7-like [Belonocnema kinseyi]